MKIPVFLLSIIFATLAGRAQYDPSRVSRKAMAMYNQALQIATEGDLRRGLHLLQKAVAADKNFLDAWLSIAGVHGELKEYVPAVENYERARSIDSVYFLDYSLPYSINLAGTGNFEKALTAVNAFLSIPDLNPNSVRAAEYRRNCYQFAINYAKTKPLSEYNFQLRNLGDSINSPVSEYFPTITIDGSQLVYTRRVNNLNEDFYSSVRKEDSWQASRALPGDINTPMNEGAQNISQDGEWLIFTGCNFPQGYGSCDLYISYLTQDGWSTPENLGPDINTESWESAPSLSPDKKDLFFASNRPGGRGSSDIYVSERRADGSWSAPRNLGTVINTPGNESAPFIHADNQTLYFTSDGHPGYGGDDLYLSKKLPGGLWAQAENLGYPINTIENEGSLVVAANGLTAYYASDRSDSKGGLDIYTFELRSDIRPSKTLWVRGRVYDANTKLGLPSAVELTALATRETISRIQTDETGNYLITLPVGKDYAFNVNRKGYLFFSENFSLSTQSKDSVFHVDIPLQPIDTDASIILKNIFFDVNRYELKPESATELDNIASMLKENPSLRIQIIGHTDSTGNADDNVSLSNARAKSVVQYLIKEGIDAKRLSARGSGSSEPIADNGTAEGRATNRRTELKVMP